MLGHARVLVTTVMFAGGFSAVARTMTATPNLNVDITSSGLFNTFVARKTLMIIIVAGSQVALMQINYVRYRTIVKKLSKTLPRTLRLASNEAGVSLLFTPT